MFKALAYGLIALCGVCGAFTAPPASAHEGHDHDKPPPLNLPVAPRVVAVTPELELVGVLSGKESLTVFLHEFATNEPIKGASLSVSAGDSDQVQAEPQGDGVFALAAPWIAEADTVDIIFALRLSDGSEDLLTGRLEIPQSLGLDVAQNTGPATISSGLLSNPIMLAAAGFLAGVFVVLIFGRRDRSGQDIPVSKSGKPSGATVRGREKVRERAQVLERTAALTLAALWALHVQAQSPALAADGATPQLPTIPSTMATDQPQRMPDSTLFIPKATQHLLSIRTQVAERLKVPRTVELSGRVTVGPKNLGRVQARRPGSFEAADGNVPYVGLAVKKGQVLGYVTNYIEAADRANITSQIAETEARIAKNRSILARYMKNPKVIRQILFDEVKGELAALSRRRAELQASMGAKEPVVAPISGIVSDAKAAVGQVVEARDILFEIIDPSEFWVEAITAYLADTTRDLDNAVAIINGNRPLKLTYLGRGLALRHHSAVLNFKIADKPDALAVGMTARVILQFKNKVDGIILPSSAIVRGPAGLPIVWIKTQPERFEPQVVKTAPFDGASVVVTAGIAPDERVVTQGTAMLNQVR